MRFVVKNPAMTRHKSKNTTNLIKEKIMVTATETQRRMALMTHQGDAAQDDVEQIQELFRTVVPIHYWIEPRKQDLENGVDLTPERKHETDSGFDIKSAVNIDLFPGQTFMVPTGLHLEIPEGFEIVLRPRSGLAGKHSITIVNSPGTVDQGYKAEVAVLLHKLVETEHNDDGALEIKDTGPFEIHRGDRIAQMVLQPNFRTELVEINPDSVSESDRGQGGFGSTGK